MIVVPLLSALALAAPPTSVFFDPAAPKLGELGVLYFQNDDPKLKRAVVQVLDMQLPLFRVSSTHLRAFIPVPMELTPGLYEGKILIGTRTIGFRLNILERSFDRSELRVSKQFTQRKTAALRARLRAEAKQIAAVWDREPGPPTFHGGMMRPVPGMVTGVFGTQRIFNNKSRSVHYGLDMDGKTGVPIRAIQAGKVALSELRWASGGTVILDHGGGFFSQYYHMSRRDVAEGDWVEPGDIIGAVGSTGRVTGPHLHLAFVIRVQPIENNVVKSPRSMYVDPGQALKLVLNGDPAYLDRPLAMPGSIASIETSTMGAARQYLDRRWRWPSRTARHPFEPPDQLPPR